MSPTNRLRRPHASSAGNDYGPVTKGRYALVVSGSPVNRVVVCRILQDSGIRPVAVDADAAFELLSTSSPRLIIAESFRDPEMLQPLLDALLRLAEAGSAPPIIYLSGIHGTELPEYPFTEVVRMPIAPESFRPLIAKYL